MLTQQRLKELLHYDPQTGVFVWTKDLPARSRAKSGTIAAAQKHYGNYARAA